MDSQEIIEPFARMLNAAVGPAEVREAERSNSLGAIWDSLSSSGYLDALIAEDRGGAGFGLADVFPLLALVGAKGVPAPVGETMIARALAAEAGITLSDGPIALATGQVDGQVVTCARVAQQILYDNGAELVLLAAADCSLRATGIEFSLAARADLSRIRGQILPRPAGGLLSIAAILRSILIAGAANQLVEQSTVFANERVQFGKPIGRQQSLQHNLAVMAENAIAARIAAQLGAAGGLAPSLAAAATAKSVSSRAAALIANSAHALHGAIGISEEYDLQLLTRRLHEWRMADGSEGYWSGLLGASRLSCPATSVDWVRAEIFA